MRETKVEVMEAEYVDEKWQVPYTKGKTIPKVCIITKTGEVLESGKDYVVTYKNNKNPGMGTIIVRGKGNYGEAGTIDSTIVPKELSNENGIRVVVKDKEESGKPGGWKQPVTVIDSNGKPLRAKDYDKKNITYTLIEEDGKMIEEKTLLPSDSVKAGAVIRIAVKGLGLYGGNDAVAYGTYRIIEKGYDISKATIQISPQSYTGEAIEITDQGQLVPGKAFLNVTKGSSRQLVLGQDIEVVENSYVKNVAKGMAKVTFRGIGQFGGNRTVSFKIIPKDVSNDDRAISYHNN